MLKTIRNSSQTVALSDLVLVIVIVMSMGTVVYIKSNSYTIIELQIITSEPLIHD